MAKIKLRGLKLLEGGAQVVSASPGDHNLLATGVCSPLALNKINLTFLTHVALDQSESHLTSLCTEGSGGGASSALIETHLGGVIKLHENVSTLSVFPHDQRPQVTGLLLETLAKKKITLQGLASSRPIAPLPIGMLPTRGRNISCEKSLLHIKKRSSESTISFSNRTLTYGA
jgi:hypothetical protein